MKRWLFLAALFGLALAAPLPQVYDRLERALAQVRLDNPTQALAALDQAQGLLRQEAEGLPPVLRDAALSNLQEARQAVLRKSAADLEARLILVRHLVAKGLYDGYFQAPPPEKAAYLARLVRATGLGQEVAELPPEEARRRLEGRFLQLLAQDLSQALSATSRPQAYLALARGYARYLVVQDSPQSTLRAQDFVQALAKVSGGEAFRDEVQELQKKVAAWRKALAGQGETTPPATAPPAPSRPSPSPPPPPATPIPKPPVASPASPGPGEASVETFYVPPWMDPATAQAVRTQAHALGYQYNFELLEALQEVQNEVGLAVAALGQGNANRGRYHLDRALWRFRAGVEPVFSHVDPALTERISRGLVHLSTATGLRTLDALTLYEALEELRQRFSQGPRANPWLDLKLALVQTAGIPRAVFFLLVAALAFFPLYLIRLTFGGRNVYWNLLGLAFLFLFLPILAEGLSYFGSLMADYGNLPLLAALSSLSIGQGLVPYLAWGLTVFLAVALAGAGLRGIAAQFGLLKERGAEVTATGTEARPATTLTSETIVEWDEEF
ncbi:MAG: hypothetical protein ACP5JV_08445, partial [Thermus sp.]|uniref:hypothetical protein n=1 Tax=Thermus sp. TaxID=275 RepID=UPI003D1259AD